MLSLFLQLKRYFGRIGKVESLKGGESLVRPTSLRYDIGLTDHDTQQCYSRKSTLVALVEATGIADATAKYTSGSLNATSAEDPRLGS
jgi:hypothetical protein